MDELISVSLHGGPDSIPRMVRVEKTKLQDGKLKIEHLGGYEHFERADPDAGQPETFRWTLRTKIAE